jgi:hypothetical protein
VDDFSNPTHPLAAADEKEETIGKPRRHRSLHEVFDILLLKNRFANSQITARRGR